MIVKAIYNPRKPNGDVSSVGCDNCGKIGAAYIRLGDFTNMSACKLICKSCLSDWDELINKSILQDVMDSVKRRRRKEDV